MKSVKELVYNGADRSIIWNTCYLAVRDQVRNDLKFKVEVNIFGVHVIQGLEDLSE